MTTKPVIGAARADGYTVTAVDYDNDVVQAGNYIQEVAAGTNTDKIPASALTGAVGYYPNILVNGGMEIDQRLNGASAFTATGTPATMLDRWQGNIAGTSTMGVQRVAALDAGSQYCMTVAYTHAGGGAGIVQQKVENFAEFRGKTLYLTARLQSSSTGCFMYIQDSAATSATVRPVVNGIVSTYTATLTVNAAATSLLVAFGFDATTTIYIDNLMLAMAPAPIDYVQRPFAEEMFLCKRYYQRIKNSTAWRTTANAEIHDSPIVFPVTMGGTPTGAVTAGTRTNIGAASLLSIDNESARMEYTGTTLNLATSSLVDVLTLAYDP